MQLTVIGAGLAGLTAAWYLSGHGAQVTVLDRRDGPGLGTSFANGALLHPSACEPWNGPGILGRLIGARGARHAPLLFRRSALPGLLSWAAGFVLRSGRGRFAATTECNVALALQSLRLLQELRASAPLRYGACARGSLHLYRSREAWERADGWTRVVARFGIESQALTPCQAMEIEPALAPLAGALAGVRHYPLDEGADPHRFCDEITRLLLQRGVRFRFGTTAAQLLRRGSRVTGIRDASGRTWEAECYLLAAGSDSAPLARTAGVYLPVIPVKGYSITLDCRGVEGIPRVPLIDRDLSMAMVPLEGERLRVVGLAEFAGHDWRVDGERIARLTGPLREILPSTGPLLHSGSMMSWAGLRPMCVDGAPIIGRSSLENLYLNTGHGQLGWTLAAGSGQLVADLVLGRAPELDPTPFSPMRF